MTGKTVACVNASGRQASSFIRVASAIGWHVRAQMRNCEGVIAEEMCGLPNVEVVEGDLDAADSNGIIRKLFRNVQLAFVNTTHWGDEVGIGCALADAAKRAGVQHYVYSSMPDHSTFGHGWKALPLWSRKFDIENHIRQIGLPATFVYTGIYNNNFTSLNYPL
ncbi:MAG: NmrA family NAD(P)-binding protein, partial [Terriglobus roseus]|nr:NmrA family NAD(P)-binding protein [Terriglobus roseus]